LPARSLALAADDRPAARLADAALDLHVDFEPERFFSVRLLALVADDKPEAQLDD